MTPLSVISIIKNNSETAMFPLAVFQMERTFRGAINGVHSGV